MTNQKNRTTVDNLGKILNGFTFFQQFTSTSETIEATCGLWKNTTLFTSRFDPQDNSEICPGLSTAGEKQRGEQKKLLPSAPDFGLNGRDSDVGRSGRFGTVPRFHAGGTCLSDDSKPETARTGRRPHRQGTGHCSLYDRRPAAGRVFGSAVPCDRGALRKCP